MKTKEIIKQNVAEIISRTRIHGLFSVGPARSHYFKIMMTDFDGSEKMQIFELPDRVFTGASDDTVLEIITEIERQIK
jgi:hypothetical protein